MSWRDNALATDALATQGYYDEDEGRLQQSVLAIALRDIFLKAPVRASDGDMLQKIPVLAKNGLTKTQLLDRVLPGFRERHELAPDEAALLKKDPQNHPQLEERSKAISDVASLLWGTFCKTSRAGQVQELLVQQSLLLVDAKGSRELEPVTVKVATDDPDVIIDCYVRTRGDSLVKVSGGVRDDCAMVGMTFGAEITERMKKELGGSVTLAMQKLLQVATPDLTALVPVASTRKVLGTSAPRG